jgi:subtilisin-like proprotein convertase family protein
MTRVVIWLTVGALAVIGTASLPGPELAGESSVPATHADGSLAVAAAFDRDAAEAWASELPADARGRLIYLNSRYALADPALPLPENAPRTPFYVRWARDLTGAEAAALKAAGAEFIGYAKPHTHMLRAADSAALSRLREYFEAHPAVRGTLTQRLEDKLTRSLRESLDAALARGGDFLINFWRDVPREARLALLVAARAELIESYTNEAGVLPLEAPHATVRVSGDGLRVLLDSPWLEQVMYAPVTAEDNADSTALSNAGPGLIDQAPYGLDGTGMIAGVWDSGPARDTHVEFQNAPAGSPINNGPRRVLRVNTTSNSDHGTHVTGTIIADGSGNAQARGYAPRAYVISHNWNNVDSERRAARHFWDHLADNHSYTNTSTDWGGYNAITQQKDFTNRELLMNMVQSAGNYASSSADGSQTIHASNAHKNGFVIGALTDTGNVTSFSSRGPGHDGRLLPHFSANGATLTGPVAGSDTAYASYSGTSMSSPSVTGAMVLLTQLYQRPEMYEGRTFAPDVAKGVLALTCRDRWHDGPDYAYGFGIVDVQAAADLLIADVQATRDKRGHHILRGTVTRQHDTREYPLQVASSADPLRVVLSWLDIHASTAAAVVLVNDLDLELEDPSGVIYYPYSGHTTADTQNYAFTTTGPNRRDNLVMVHVGSPTPGNWKVRVRAHSMPAFPQTGFPNEDCGFVLVASQPIQTERRRFEMRTPVAIPDDDPAGWSGMFDIGGYDFVAGARVKLRIRHQRRGDLQVRLRHPSGHFIELEVPNAGSGVSSRDLYAVLPDTRQHAETMDSLVGLPAAGQWRVDIADTEPGNTGVLEYLHLEVDLRGNTAPVAMAGPDQVVREVETVQLDGSSSYDPDGDAITYRWDRILGRSINLQGADTATPWFIAPTVGNDEEVVLRLWVTDGSGAFHTDTVKVTILKNRAPVVLTDSEVAILETTSRVLDASASFDPDGDPITFLWTQSGGTPTLSLAGADTATPTLTAPAVSQDAQAFLNLQVSDDRGLVANYAITVRIARNLPPVANAGIDFAVRFLDAVSLNGAASYDPNPMDAITYSWRQASGRFTVELQNADTPHPSFVAPGGTDVLTFELTVTDMPGASSTSSVRVYVNRDGEIPVPGRKSDDGSCSVDGGGALWWLALLALVSVLGRARSRRSQAELAQGGPQYLKT